MTATERSLPEAAEERLGHARRWWVLATMTVCLLVVIMGNTTLNVAIPTLQRELGASQGELQWAIDAYILVFAGLLFSWGVVGDQNYWWGAIFLIAVPVALLGIVATLLVVPEVP